MSDERPRLADFPVVQQVTSRWSDNDMYGHLNNAVYYELFDSAINTWLLRGLPPAGPDAPLGVVAESGCRFLDELHYPDDLAVGLRVTRLGTSSVTYELALARADDPGPVAALGHWVHVYVDPHTRRPVPMDGPLRDLLSTAVRAD